MNRIDVVKYLNYRVNMGMSVGSEDVEFGKKLNEHMKGKFTSNFVESAYSSPMGIHLVDKAINKAIELFDIEVVTGGHLGLNGFFGEKVVGYR